MVCALTMLCATQNNSTQALPANSAVSANAASTQVAQLAQQMQQRWQTNNQRATNMPLLHYTPAEPPAAHEDDHAAATPLYARTTNP